MPTNKISMLFVQEVLKYTLPTLLLVLTALYIFRQYQQNLTYRLERKNMRRKPPADIVLTTRLQAYERLALFLERTHPEALLVRHTTHNNITVRDLQQLLLENIRNEFEHNFSQQVYVSEKLWEAIKTSKDTIVRAINIASDKHSLEDSAIELAKTVLHDYENIETDIVAVSLELLRKEVKLLWH